MKKYLFLFIFAITLFAIFTFKYFDKQKKIKLFIQEREKFEKEKIEFNSSNVKIFGDNPFLNISNVDFITINKLSPILLETNCITTNRHNNEIDYVLSVKYFSNLFQYYHATLDKKYLLINLFINDNNLPLKYGVKIGEDIEIIKNIFGDDYYYSNNIIEYNIDFMGSEMELSIINKKLEKIAIKYYYD